jgi:two-component system CheB/CheR fusion protein
MARVIKKDALSQILNDREYYRTLVENLEDYAMILIDTDGRIRSWNKGAEHLLQYKKSEAIGKSGAIFFTDDDKLHNAYEHELQTARRRGRAEDERWHMRKDGSTFWGSGIMVPISVGKKLVGYVKILRDRTDKRAFEKRKDDFIAIASHELRTPLAIIRTSAELLELEARQKNDTHALKTFEVLQEHLRLVVHLVDDLLDLSKIEAGKLRPHKRRLEIRAFIEEIISNYQSVQMKHVIHLAAGDKAYIYADKDQLAQILLNLFSNAVKYSPMADKIDVRIRTDKQSVYVYVQDYGIGMSKKHMEKIFDQFYRAEEKRHQSTSLGIGLYVSKKLVELNGGHMGIEKSEKGKGSTLYFTLPRLK